MTCDIMVSVLMTDPAVGYLPGQGYEPYDRGTELDLWVKTANGSASLGVVWPGKFSYILPNMETGKIPQTHL